jgi:hypothetical protein
VANRQIVVISLDPFDQAHPAIAMSLLLFAPILMLIIGGVVVGGIAAWSREQWRAPRPAWEARAPREVTSSSRGSVSGPASSDAGRLRRADDPAAGG